MTELQKFEVSEFLNELMDSRVNTEPAGADYTIGLMLEYEFNNRRDQAIPWQELHKVAHVFCGEHLLK